jgi:transcriptional regulator with PAS, ATPase and Fis domain
MNTDWSKELNIAITIMDAEGTIIYMNDKSAKTFEKDGGKNLIGKNLDSCHTERSNQIISKLLNNKETNAYTIEKNGVKKLIYQTPWYENEKCMGLVEFSLEIPFEMPHFLR